MKIIEKKMGLGQKDEKIINQIRKEIEKEKEIVNLERTEKDVKENNAPVGSKETSKGKKKEQEKEPTRKPNGKYDKGGTLIGNAFVGLPNNSRRSSLSNGIVGHAAMPNRKEEKGDLSSPPKDCTERRSFGAEGEKKSPRKEEEIIPIGNKREKES